MQLYKSLKEIVLQPLCHTYFQDLTFATKKEGPYLLDVVSLVNLALTFAMSLLLDCNVCSYWFATKVENSGCLT